MTEQLAADAPGDEGKAAFMAAYDKATTEPIVDVEPVEAKPTEPVEAKSVEPTEPVASEPVEAVAEEPPVIEAPSFMPEGIRKHWAAMPEEARDALSKSQQGMSQRLAEATRLAQGLDPIKNVLVKAAEEIPNLKGMRPDQVAAEVMGLARISAEFNTKPVETLMGLIDKHGMREAIRAAIGGDAPAAQAQEALHKEIAGLKAQLARIGDPGYLEEQFSTMTERRSATDAVRAFAEKAEHWAAVEGRIPMLIQAVQEKLGATATLEAVLRDAYELAVNIYLPDKAKAPAAVEAAAPPDPARAKAALQAKAVNIGGKVESASRPLTERQVFDAAWDRANRR